MAVDLPSNWLDQVEDTPPVNVAGALQLTNRQEFPNFWRFTLDWPGASAQIYNFVGEGEIAHKAPCMTISCMRIEAAQLSPRLEGWADPERAVFISMAGGHSLYHAILQIRYEDASDFNLFPTEPDVAAPLRRAKESYLSGELVDHWRTFAINNDRDQIVYDCPNPKMHSREALANGFVPEYTDNGRTYWRKDI